MHSHITYQLLLSKGEIEISYLQVIRYIIFLFVFEILKVLLTLPLHCQLSNKYLHVSTNHLAQGYHSTLEISITCSCVPKVTLFALFPKSLSKFCLGMCFLEI